MNLVRLDFCPHCSKKSLQWDGEKKWSCTECEFVLFHNCAAAVAVLLKHEDHILFTRRNQMPGKGLLDLPGGFVDPKESASEAASRELNEELGLSLDEKGFEILSSLPNEYEYKGILYNTLDLFLSYPLDVKPNFEMEQNEISETIWLSLNELETKDLAFDSQKKFFNTLKKER